MAQDDSTGERGRYFLGPWSQMEEIPLVLQPDSWYPDIPWKEAQTIKKVDESTYETVLPEPQPPAEPAPVPITDPEPPPPKDPDQEAQAEALKEAAESGAPLAEECEKDEKKKDSGSSSSSSGASGGAKKK